MRSVFRSAALLLSACDPDVSAVRLDLPVSSTHEAVILHLEVTGNTTSRDRAEAVVVADGQLSAPLVELVPPGGVARLSAALFEQSLEALRIDSGPLPTLTEGRALPDGATFLEASVMGSEVSPWSPSATVPLGLQRLRLQPLERCGQFQTSSLELPVNRDVRFVRPVRAGEAEGLLVGLSGETAAWVEPATAFELRVPPGEPCGGPKEFAQFFDAYQQADQDLWLVGRCGEIWRGQVRLSERRIDADLAEGATHRDPMLRIAGPSAGAPTALFVISGTGRLDRVDLGRSVAEEQYIFAEGEGAMVVPQDDHLVLAWSQNPVVLRFKNQMRTTENVPLPSGDPGLRFLISTETLGLVVVSVGGRFFRERPEGWVPLPLSPLAQLRDVVAYRGTFAALTDDRRILTYDSAEQAWCVASDSGVDRAQRLGVLGDTLVAVGDVGGDGKNWVRVLQRLPE